MGGATAPSGPGVISPIDADFDLALMIISLGAVSS
jgi:hypothetical protein